MIMIRTFTLFACFAASLQHACLLAADWPMWRADAERSAASAEHLPAKLSPLWQRDFGARVPVWDDPLNQDLMTYDRILEPIVMNGRLFVGLSDSDQLIALDTATGQKVWTCFADGPVRLPPVAEDGRVCFTSDDGWLYCVNAGSGEVQWSFRGAPGSRKAIGNQRLVSAWPARGGAVLREGTVYFAASIWPMMGTFIYALDVKTGAVRWVNDSTGAQYTKQPHSAPSFAGVAPQGALVATATRLIVPGGRSVPAVFDRQDGTLKYFEINAGGKGTGGSFVAASADRFFVHTRLKGTRAFDLESGLKTAFMPNEPVITDDLIYSAETVDGRPVVRAYQHDQTLAWQVNADGRGDLILAGDRLYAAGGNKITVIRLPSDGQSAKVTTTIKAGGTVERLLAADGKLFAVSQQGSIMAFGDDGDSENHNAQARQVTDAEIPPEASATAKREAERLLADVDRAGYAFWFGASDRARLDAVAAVSQFRQLAVIDSNRQIVEDLRQEWDAAGIYGRVTAHCSDAASFGAPPYVASVVFVDQAVGLNALPTGIQTLYESVRPYGGILYLLTDQNRDTLAASVAALNLEQADIFVTDFGVQVRRLGALPGSADWTHQYGDVANTIKSNDSRVRLPLGVLWFGGSSNMDVLPRHGHGPPEQVVGGRLFIQGMNSLTARDVYTGRVLWKREFDNLGTFNIYYDDTYEDTPLDPRYNQVHIPGANGRGTNFVVADDRVYLLEGDSCHVLDPVDGSTLLKIRMPEDASGQPREWGYIGVYQNLLLGGHGYANYRERHDLTIASDQQLKKNRAGFGSRSLDKSASQGLIVFDRHSGKQLWSADAHHSFWHNGIVAGGGKIYCLDRTPKIIAEALRRRGRGPLKSHRIVAFDAHTGQQEWEVRDNIFGTWLGYSEQHDLLLQAGAAASDRLSDEVSSGMAVYHGRDGSVKWRNDRLSYSGPCILHNDWIITNANSYAESAGAFHLTDGRQKLVANPLTGELQPWKVTRAYGCNNMIASENLLTFRSGAAGFYDLLGEGGTGNFGGFKSGCTANLVAANGVLNAPDYTRTCSCAYQNQTSLALVHMPELDFWTVAPLDSMAAAPGTLRQVGINFGAPGDRRDRNGLLWLEYPAIAGPSPPLTLTMNDEVTFFQQHATSGPPGNEPWILASGAENITRLSIDLSLLEQQSAESGIAVDHSDDDAEEQEDGSVNLTSSDLELIQDSGTQMVGIRFNSVNLPREATIRSAHIQFVCDEPAASPTALLIAAEDSGHAARFTTERHDISSRARTTAEVDWRPEAWMKVGEAGDAQRTPDLAPLVRAVTSRPDWKPGNSIVFLINGTGKRVAVAAGKGGPGSARLILDADEQEPAAAEPAAHKYTVGLYFAAPRDTDSGVRRFDVSLQGRSVLQNVVLDPADSQTNPAFVKMFHDIMITDRLNLQLTPQQGATVLSGISLQRTD